MAEGVSTAVAVAGVKAFAELLPKLTVAVASAAGKSFKAIFEKFDATFGPHLQATFDRCTKIKTLLNKDEPVSLLMVVELLANIEARRALRSETIDDVFGFESE
jgi:hypothetical protein